MTGKPLTRRLFGDRAFYRMVLAVVVPIIVQNGITNFVSLLDNIMVGQVGTEQMSGVAIVNQLLFVYSLCIFGGLGGIGIFTAQFCGRGETEGIRSTFRLKVLLGVLLTAAAVALLLTAGEPLIRLYLSGDAGGTDPELALSSGLDYLSVMLWGLPAFAAVQMYTSTLRECSETVLPMKAGIAAVLVNLFLNWLLIPRLGVTGAGAATVVSRWAECLIVVIWTHRHADRCPWIRGVWRRLGVPRPLLRRVAVKGLPLLVNEALWSAAQAVLTQCYSVRGVPVVAAMNITSTIGNLFSIVFISMGSAVSIIVGQRLGANRLEEARDVDAKLIVFSVLMALVTGGLMALMAPFFPRLYNTTDDVRALAVTMMRLNALFMPMHAFMNCAYFTLRAGGRTIVTFLFDSAALWLVSLPIAFVLSRYTGLSVPWIFVCVSLGDLAKCVLGFILVKRGVWVRNIVQHENA